jgi:hypothetical protein
MSSSRKDDQGLLHDYLGPEPLPTNSAIIKAEIERAFAVTEMEIGWMNATHADPKSRLNEQKRVYELSLLRWMLKAIRKRDRGFFTRLNKALAVANFSGPHTKVPRELIQAASTRSRELGRRSEASLEKLKAKLEDLEWLARATDKEFETVVGELRYEWLRTLDINGPDLLLPTKGEVWTEWEDRARRKRTEIKQNREMKTARLSKLPQVRPGRPRGRKKRSGG